MNDLLTTSYGSGATRIKRYFFLARDSLTCKRSFSLFLVFSLFLGFFFFCEFFFRRPRACECAFDGGVSMICDRYSMIDNRKQQVITTLPFLEPIGLVGRPLAAPALLLPVGHNHCRSPPPVWLCKFRSSMDQNEESSYNCTTLWCINI